MYPQMPQPFPSYSPEMNMFSVHPLTHSTQPLGHNPYSHLTNDHDPLQPYAMVKSIDHYQFTSPTVHHHDPQQQKRNHRGQQQRHQFQNPAAPLGGRTSHHNQSFAPLPPPSTPSARSVNSISSDETNATTRQTKSTTARAPKFDRTYTDALEDELFDESSNVSYAAHSQNPLSRHAAPNFAFNRVAEYPNPVRLERNIAPIRARPVGQQRQMGPQHQNVQDRQLNVRMSVPNAFYTSSTSYDPLANQSDTQRLSSEAVADSVRRLQAPNGTTVSPREAFLDYSDNAEFHERTLFSSSASPQSQGKDVNARGPARPPDMETNLSNNDGIQRSKDNASSLPSISYALHDEVSVLATEAARSTPSSAYHSGFGSGEQSIESVASSESEYDPRVTSSRRLNRASGRPIQLFKTIPCPECGKRFEKSQSLLLHRRNAHNKGSGSTSGVQQRFSNTSHRCDYVDPATGRTCNTVFSRP
jgi:hypothetical protein